MSHRLAGAALAVLGLLVGLGLGTLVGREGNHPRPDAHPPGASSAPANPDAALVAALRKEIADLRAREARYKLETLGGKKAHRTPANSPAGDPGTPPRAHTGAPTRPASPEALLVAMREAVTANDAPTLAYLHALLQQSIADGSVRAAEVVAWLKTESNPQLLDQLVDALSSALTGELPGDVLGGLLAALEQGAAEANRAAALHVLNASGAVAPEALPRLLAFAEHEPSADLRMEALGSLSRYFGDENSPQHGSIADALLRAARSDENPRLRAEAVMALGSSSLTSTEGLTMLEILRSDHDEDVRSTVVGMLPYMNSVSPESRLRAIEEQYSRDDSTMVRRTLLTALIALGAAKSQGVLERIRGVDSGLQQEVDDYLTILRSGVSDAAEIEMKKSALHDGNPLDSFGR